MPRHAEKTLLLLFSAGDDLFACDAEPIVEIIPKVKLKEIPGTPSFVAGMLNFGGQPIPVIDFSCLVKGRPSSESLHTRIILFSHGKILGVIAEKVTETTTLDLSEFANPGLQTKEFPYLGNILSSPEETVQLVLIDELFKATEHRV